MSVTIGTPLQSSAFKVLLLGSGELGKEVVISLQRLGVEVHAADRYDHAPAMQVAHYAYTLNMADATELKQLIEKVQPNLIVPEIEAIATSVLLEVEAQNIATVIPSAKAVNLTMNREGIRRLAAEELGLPTSAYRFANSLESFRAACDDIGYPNFVKPVSTKKPINIAKLLLGVSSKGGKVATTSIELIAAMPMLPKAILSHNAPRCCEP